ncbi:heme exporter protein CcmD [Marinomonas transparens]|uniref:Heme exporter protein D n=1 Tax=Marinomonas transparens TaxID=2795388 RepID=A0A934N583_9GAMM|nr:heme exporter protein CcmD [Marinomonas transparens]MBJ7536771.1 heme exporter protein CcmD [Marinomonas transparens]
MAFDSLADFFTMGTHGLYVWSTYGFSLSALLILILNTLGKRRKIRDQLCKRFLRDQNA